MRLYNFMQDRHWYEDVAHIFIGLTPLLGWTREHFQWPPGDTVSIKGVPYAPHDRVADSYRDFLGYSIGGAIRTAVLIGLLRGGISCGG